MVLGLHEVHSPELALVHSFGPTEVKNLQQRDAPKQVSGIATCIAVLQVSLWSSTSKDLHMILGFGRLQDMPSNGYGWLSKLWSLFGSL